MHRCVALATLGVLLGVLGSVTAAEEPAAGDLLLDAQRAEEMAGDLPRAIALYEQVAGRTDAKATYRAQALFRQAMCYRKLGRETQAIAALESLIATFAEETTVSARAQAMLEELRIVDPATLMPPGTLAYIEVGSPGKQVETVFNMLRGTPGENPIDLLELIGWPGEAGSDKAPGDILRAIFNPSTLEELKKVRGMALGILDVNATGVRSLVVLYPGECHTLRGLLEAAIRVAGTPGPPVGPMETLSLDAGVVVALDKQAILVAQGSEVLRWAAQQYLGLTHDTCLAEREAFFERVTKKARQSQTLTVWADTDALYGRLRKLQGPEGLPHSWRRWDQALDFRHVDASMLTFSLTPNGVHLGLQANLLPAHRCPLYQLTRTPPLRQPCPGVPTESFLQAGLALGTMPRADAAQLADLAPTGLPPLGLEILRDLFTNLGQISIFAVPPEPNLALTGPGDLLTCWGLSITSRRPEQTRQRLERLLRLLARPLETAAPVTAFAVPTTSGGRQSWYLGQRGSATVLAGSRRLLDQALAHTPAARAAPRGGDSPLGPVLQMPSKLLTLRLGGLLRTLDRLAVTTYHNPANPGHTALQDLAELCAQTTVALHTEESADRFRLEIGVRDLPGLARVAGPLATLSRFDIRLPAQASDPRPPDGAVLAVGPVTLRWTPGVSAQENRLHLGADPNDMPLVESTTHRTSVETSLPLAEPNDTWVWRVDTVPPGGRLVPGRLWHFRTVRPVAHYPLCGDANDRSGHGHQGVVIGVPPAEAFAADGRLRLGGQPASFLRLPGAPSPFGAGLTWMFWLRPTAVGGGTDLLVFDNQSGRDHLAWRCRPEGRTLSFEVTCAGRRQRVQAPQALRVGRWQHLAVTCDATGRVVQYRDGQVLATGTLPPPRPVARTTGALGRATEGEGAALAAVYADVRIFDAALSPEAVRDLFERGRDQVTAREGPRREDP